MISLNTSWQAAPVMKNSPIRIVLIVICLLTLARVTFAQITIAAAGDLQSVMPEIARRFQTQTGSQVRVTFGSSGNFLQQLANGAPFDLFFSANLDYPKKLQQDGFAEPGSLYEYAQGKLVIWVLNSSALDIHQGMRLLVGSSVGKIAIANPQHAPYGQAAVAAMKNRGIYDQVKSKLVLGENVSQALSFAISGSADVGFVALSLAISPGVKEKGRFAEVPRDDYPAIRQACVILKSSKHKEIARQFLGFIKTPAISALLREYGFDLPESAGR
jgi:molybdate transport system substrate-binding protein